MPGLSPLLALFQAGDVDRELRLFGAGGGVMPQERDDAALLVILALDRDAGVAALARETLARCSASLRSSGCARLGAMGLGERRDEGCPTPSTTPPVGRSKDWSFQLAVVLAKW